MVPDEVSATGHDRRAPSPDRRGKTDPEEQPYMMKPPIVDGDRTEPRRDYSGWTPTSPDLPDSLIHPIDARRPNLAADRLPSSSLSRSSPRPYQLDSHRSLLPSEDVAASTGSVRSLPPDLQQGQLAFSAMQFLPVPVIVVSSLKRVVSANEAMGRLLGVVHDLAEEQDIAALDRIRGQSLPQLGIEVMQGGRVTPFDWEGYLELLGPTSSAREKAHNGRDINGPASDDESEHSSIHNDGLDYPERVSYRPGRTGVLEVLIARDDTPKWSSESIPRAGTSAREHRAKVAINPFQINGEQTYYNMVFTDIQTRSSLPPQHPSEKSVTGKTDEVPSVVASTSPDSVPMEHLISRMKEEDEERFQTMCDTMPQLVWATTPDGDLDFYNQRWYDYTGLTPEVSMGHGWMEAVHPDDVAESERLFQQSLKTGEPFETEYRCRSKTGEWNWFIVRASPFRSKETGKIKRWLGTCTHAHESIESRREVERTWQQLLTVISHAQVTVFQVDTQRRVTLLEGAMVEEALGGHESGPRWYGGRDMYEVFGEAFRATDGRQQRFLGPIEAILAGHPAEILRDDEFAGRYYSTRFLPIGVKDEDGLIRGANVQGVIGVIRDVTELKSKEADISRQAREKQQLMASEAAAKEASKLKSQFLANMSHEIRTPITGVIGMAELLLDLDLGEEQREYTENIYRSANALLTVINDILDFSKVESGRLDIEEVQFSLSIIVRDVNKMLSFAAQRKNLDFSSDISDDIANDLVVMGDPGRVRQIITNLLTNSIKFTNQGHVKFSVLKESETADTIEIRFVIEDTGIGIEDEVRKRLFVPFSQGDASTARKFGGTGLGLTICKSLLDLMRGRITLESIVGSGTTATFWIPFKKPGGADTDLVRIDPLSDRLQSDMSVSGNSSEPDGLLGAIPPELASSGLLDGLKPSRSRNRKISSDATPSVTPLMEVDQAERGDIHILVVEDNPINQQIATKTIKKLGFSVSAAWNGKEALDYLVQAQEGKERKPDIILMDVQMPVIDGYKCTHLLRYHLPYKTYVGNVPIIAMTASAIQGDREKCRKAGMDDYLAKPVRGKILEKMLVRWTAPRRPAPPQHVSSHGSEVSEVACSNAGEHCDNVDIPCVEHDDDDFLDLRQTPLDDLGQHPIDAVLPLIGEQQHLEEPQAQSSQQAGIASSPTKPPLTRSDTEETQVVRRKVERNDSVQTAKPPTGKTSNETDGELAAQGRHAKLFDAAGVRSEQIPPPHRASPEPVHGSGVGEALTEANMEKHLQEEEYKLWHMRDDESSGES